jgi:parallel beta-helix repeat protein
MKRSASVIIVSLVMLGTVVSILNIQLGRAFPPKTVYVDDDNISGPWDGTPQYPYQNITSALEHAFTNDTIFVYNGTYMEKVRINNSISLVGENKYSTIIDGNFTGTVMGITANNVNVTNFTIRNGKYWGDGIRLDHSRHCTINNNIITDNLDGIELTESSNNTIAGNFVLCPPSKDGEPLCWNGIIMYYSNGNVITNNTISSGYVALYLGGSDCNIVNGNRLYSNWYGIRVHGSNNNTIVANEIFNNKRGIHIASYGAPGNNNLVYQNDFIDNTQQATEFNCTNIWHSGYPAGGNYWSNYNGTDQFSGFYQNETGSDGIGDIPYIIPYQDSSDQYPLMKPLFWWNLADVNYDFKVDLYDAVKVLIAYGSEPDDDNWNPQCDIAQPYGQIDLFDAVFVLVNYGKKCS